jgi:hypothetical protein
VPVWIVASLLAMATAFVWTPDRISSRLRLGSAVLIALVPIVHVALNGGSFADPVAWVIDAILIGLAALCGLSLLRRGAVAPVRQEAVRTPAE